ncbi:hypothetical protein BU17DRAFT_92632 [Hysterangium stoloniferum]|nr:hypothetical protein BU17DRAFT_92632 [Hysterangium stoloniferum]
MVSPLWKACQEGDATRVDEILVEASGVDIEIKDHTGVTPLIQAIKGGHVEIVKALIGKGADPSNASAQGRPDTYTTDPLILHILADARGDLMPYPDRLVEQPQLQQHPQPQFYPYPPYGYPPYPPQDGWYPPAPQQQGQPSPQDGDPVAANLPPPEVLPCLPLRHILRIPPPPNTLFRGPAPAPGPVSGVLPPPASAPAPPPPPPVPPHFSPTAQGHGHIRAHSHSEIMSMSPPPPPPPPMMGYMPMSPTGYQGYPPPPPPPPPAGVDESGTPLSPYANGAPGAGPGGYPAPYGPNGYANGVGHHGPGGGRPRRGSVAFRDREGRMLNGNGGGFGGKKPACLFYPSGRCRNGDECRFPHVMSDPNNPPPPHGHGGRPHFPSRRGGYNGNGGSTGLEDRMGGMRIGAHARNRSQTNPGQGQGQSPAPQGAQQQQQQQRIPSADEFPVLNGHLSTSGSENGVNSHSGHAQEHGSGAESGHTNGHATPNTPANGHANGHAHYQNGWANAMNGTGPTAAQILREGSRGTSPVPKPVPPKAHAHGPPLENKAAAVASKAGDVIAGKPASLSVKENLKPVEVKIAA